MSVGPNAIQPNANPGTGSLLDFRTAGDEQSLDVSPAYFWLGGPPVDLSQSPTVLVSHGGMIAQNDTII